MQDFQKIGTGFLELLRNNPLWRLQDEIVGTWIDQFTMLFIKGYYWQYFVLGNADEWINMGMTMNGMRPIRKS